MSNPAEWQARVDLAALYRLVALHGWDDMIFTHISARVPGPAHHFLINPYGRFFGEITASSLVKPAGLIGWGSSSILRPSRSIFTSEDAVISPKNRP